MKSDRIETVFGAEEAFEELFEIPPPDQTASERALDSMLESVAQKRKRRRVAARCASLLVALLIASGWLSALSRNAAQVGHANSSVPQKEPAPLVRIIRTMPGAYTSQRPGLGAAELGLMGSSAHEALTIIETPGGAEPEVEDISDAALLALFPSTPSILITMASGESRFLLAEIVQSGGEKVLGYGVME